MTVVNETGDLFTSAAPIYAQGVNIHGVMGSGIAVEFKKRYPDMFQSYNKACRTNELQAGGIHVYQSAPSGKWVFNLASQDKPGRHAKLEWLAESLFKASDKAFELGVPHIALPRIGAGIGGLNWDECYSVIQWVANQHKDITYEVWSLPHAK